MHTTVVDILQKNTLRSAWSALTSKVAVTIYLVVLMLAIVAIIVSVMVNEYKTANRPEQDDPAPGSGSLGGNDQPLKVELEKKPEPEDTERFFMLSQTDK